MARPELVVLAADLDIEQTVKGLLARPQALRIRPVRSQLVRDTMAGHDGGTFKRAHDVLEPFSSDSLCRALVLFDRAWDGAPSRDAKRLAEDVERRLAPMWGERARCVVLDPEIEVWVFSDSPHVDRTLGFAEGQLRTWLREKGQWPADQLKPGDPKTAMLQALRRSHIKPSASLFGQLATKVGLERCIDPGFRLFVETLRTWFPP